MRLWWAYPAGVGDVVPALQVAQLLLVRPAHEVPDVAAVRGMRDGQPILEVALVRGGQGEIVCGEPVKQADRGFDFGPDPGGLVQGGVSATQAAAEPHRQPGSVVTTPRPPSKKPSKKRGKIVNTAFIAMRSMFVFYHMKVTAGLLTRSSSSSSTQPGDDGYGVARVNKGWTTPREESNG